MPQALPPLLRVPLSDGRVATVSLGWGSTAIAVGDERVWSYDLAGRPYALVREPLTYRRALSGEMLVKGRDGPRRVRTRLRGAPALAVVEEARGDVALVRAAVAQRRPAGAEEALTRLDGIIAMDGAALERDESRFATVYRPVGILPPDHYLALVVQVTEGCSWNECTFCGLYRDVPFRARSPEEVERHCAELSEWLGPSLALRRTLFLGSANALCLGHDRLAAVLPVVGRWFPVAPPALDARRRSAWLRERPHGVTGMAAFVDAWTGHRKSVEEYRIYAALGLRQVYVGLETGDRDLLRWLGKAGDPEEAVELVQALHGAGIAAGVIVLVGAGGERFDDAHVAGTVGALRRMGLGAGDRVFLSEIVARPGVPYARNALADGTRPLDAASLARQSGRLVEELRDGQEAAKVPIARYDIEEFVY